ncbi:MAG: hypothetical protein KC561_09645, partial [Myxococcales bacterium]|nr:hypothetical protein [Myxococcales bacterium]
EGFECELSFNGYTYEQFEWTCSAADDELPVRAEGEACSRADEPTDRCGEGTLCMASAAGGEDTGVCRSFCDSSGSSAEGMCPVSESGDAIFGEEETVDNFSYLEFTSVGTGSYNGIGAFLRDGTDEESLAMNSSGVDLLSGDTATAILSLSEAGSDSYALHLFEEAPAEVVESEGYGAEFFNTLSDAMDVYYVDGEDAIMVGSTVNLTLSPLTNWFGWEDGDEVTEFAFLGLDEGFRVGSVYNRAGTVTDLFVVGEAGNDEFPIQSVWLDEDYPTGESDETAVRFLHGLVDEGPVVGGYLRSGTFYPVGTLDFGESSDWVLIPNDVNITVRFYSEGSIIETSPFNTSALAVEALTFGLYENDEENTTFALPADAPAADVWHVVATNLSSLNDLEVAFAARMIADAIPAGGYGTLGDSLTGDSVLSDNVRLLFADALSATAGDAPALVANTEYADDEVTTVVLHYTPEGVDLFDFHGDEYDASGLDGEAALRYINVSGAGETLLRFPGLSEYVCIRSLVVQDLGTCAEACDPTMPTGVNGCDVNEDDEDGLSASCLPTVPPGEDTFVDPADLLGYCEEVDDETATLEEGDACGQANGPTCGPGTICVGDGQGGANCTAYCRPFILDGDEGCPEGQVCASTLFDGTSAFGLCSDIEIEDTEPTDSCDSTDGLLCGTNGTFCITISQAGDQQCVQECIVGVTECAGDTDCQALNPATLPAWFGICL